LPDVPPTLRLDQIDRFAKGSKISSGALRLVALSHAWRAKQDEAWRAAELGDRGSAVALAGF